MAAILIVIHSDGLRRSLADTLRGAGFTVIEATTGAEAFRLAANGPDLALVDDQLPDEPGSGLCQRLKANPVTARIPTLLCAGTFPPEATPMPAGGGSADALLAWPIETPVLLSCVHGLLHARAANEALELAQEQLELLLAAHPALLYRCRAEGAHAATFVVEGAPSAPAGPGENLFESLAEWMERIHPDDRARVLAGLLGVLEQGHQSLEYRLRQADGSYGWRREERRLLRDAGGKRREILGAWFDITAQKQTEAALEQAQTELERRVAERTAALSLANTELEQFAQVASHDLQEPLRTISSYLQLLANRYSGGLDAGANEFIRVAIEGARRAQQLINDLLAYTRVGAAGKPPQPTSSAAAYERALGNLRLALEDSQASVTHDPLPVVLAEETQLVQVFQNLLSNALKFRGAEPPRVHVAVRPEGEDWVFAVRDNGLGIAPEFQERLFQMFQRSPATEPVPGSGLGLAIVKRIVERHAGRVWAESQPGRGATFFFTLRAAPSGARGDRHPPAELKS